LRIRRTPLLALALAVVLGGAVFPAHARADMVRSENLYRVAGYLTQDPYTTACTAAATQIMLNLTALAGSPGNGFVWHTSVQKNTAGDPNDLTSIFAYARAHDTLSSAGLGSDPHGWRNALNYFGWGLSTPTADVRVYDDRTFIGFDAAVKAAVIAIARYHKPVGMLAWAGRHAQVITGYVVTGEDPAISTNFVVNSVYLTDPLASSQIPNALVSVTALRLGSLVTRLRRYSQTDSPYDDPYTAGWIRSSARNRPSEWFGRFVLILPIRDGLPDGGAAGRSVTRDPALDRRPGG